MNSITRTLVISLITLCFTAAVSAATFTVNTTNDTVDATPGDGVCADAASSCSLRAAISEANALAGADIITLPAGTYTQSIVAANEDLNAGGDWDVTSELTINGAGEGTTFIQANAAAGAATERVINVRAGGNLTLSQMTVRNGRFTGTMTTATRGAGIENLGILTINNVTVRDNQLNSTSGNSIAAGIANGGSAFNMNNSTITANTNTRVTGGSAFGGGLANLAASTITITNSSISGNTAVTTTTIAAAFGFGAGVYLEGVVTFNATNSQFNNNTAAGVLTNGGTNGVGIRALSAAGAMVVNLTDCQVNGNSGSGGTINSGTGIQLFTNTLAAATMTATFNRTTVNGNSTATSSNTNFGTGVNVQANGGPLTLNVNSSTISNNTGAFSGGGIAFSDTVATLASTHTLNITNSTISGNTATSGSGGSGGGIFIESPSAVATSSANLDFTTVANNTATTLGGGVSAAATSAFSTKNSVFANNTNASAPEIAGTIASLDYNHFESTTGGTVTGATGNNTTGDPNLGALANNGGATQTHLPNTGSAVINGIPTLSNGCGTTISFDQRGTTRPQGGACDKGSVEVASVATGPFDISGTVTTTDGRPIRNVIVTVVGPGFPATSVQTGMFGTFSFPDLMPETYTVSVAAKRFTFASPSQNIVLNADNNSVSFVADPGFGVLTMADDGQMGSGGFKDCEDPDCPHEGHTGTGGLAAGFGVLIGDRNECNDPHCSHEGHMGGGGRGVRNAHREGVLVGDRADASATDGECKDPDCTHEGHTGTGGRPGVLIGDRAGTVCEDPNCEDGHTGTGGRGGDSDGDNGRTRTKRP